MVSFTENISFCSSNHRDNEYVNDFEAMLAKKKEEGSKRRKKRDIDIINDNDDIIDQLIQDMRAAAEVGDLRLQNISLHLVHSAIHSIIKCFHVLNIHWTGWSWIKLTTKTGHSKDFHAKNGDVTIDQERFTVGIHRAQYSECSHRLVGTITKSKFAMPSNSWKHP